MMRWNSTKTYTEDDILRMQQEAVTRVHEFQSRAKALPFYDVPESAITPYREPAAEQAPYETPEPEPVLAPDTPSDANEELPPVSQPETMQPERMQPEMMEPDRMPPQPVAPPFGQSNNAPMPQQPSDPITGLLSKLNLDGETLLILGLMFLLYNEKADNVLLIALAYLLL